ncbi:hypothetical protein HYX10_00675 [Candidatus Woesearchaeota archaeon]|nr:hypothetical protein [Candidatus Woesearchaeota archaeon]
MNLRNNVSPEHRFYCADGSTFQNLNELASGLRKMRPEVFQHHANAGNNDFRNWVRDVYGNKQLADQIARAKLSLEASQIIARKLNTTGKRAKRAMKNERLHKKIHKHIMRLMSKYRKK